MSDRATKEITTPGGHKAVLKTYVTGAEKREIDNVFINASKVHVEANNPSATVGENNMADLVNKAEDVAIEKIVVSIDGDEKEIVKRLLDLPSADSDSIIREVEKVQKGLGEKKE